MEAQTKHWIHLKDKTETAFLFPSDGSSAGHLQRQAVWKLLKKLYQRKVQKHLKGEGRGLRQFRNYICNTVGGNPQITPKMIDWFRKETYIWDELISDIIDSSAIKELDMALPIIIIIIFSSLMVVR